MAIAQFARRTPRVAPQTQKSKVTGLYPLTIPLLVIGLLGAAAISLLTETWLLGYSFFVFAFTMGLTWRRDELPIFPFILAIQWLQVTSGYIFSAATGIVPADVRTGDIPRTEVIALTGLIILACGIRAVTALARERRATEELPYVRNLSGLFGVVIVIYAINFMSVSATRSSGIMFQSLLQARQVPLLLLWSEVLRQKRGSPYLWLSLVWVFVPSLGSYLSDFKTPLFLLLIVAAADWKPWEHASWRFTIVGAVRLITVFAASVFLLLTWQAGIKGDTRRAYRDDAIGATPLARVQFFADSAVRNMPIVFEDTAVVAEGLVSRIWYVALFSRVLEYVPDFEPHANGELLGLAVSNATQPRVLFPDKPPLPSDSYYTRRFAALDIDDTSETSISIGYMAEFYADWGMVGMFLSTFVYGALMGSAAWLVRRFSPSALLTNPGVVTVLITMAFFEAQFVKTLGSLVMNVIVTIGVIWFFHHYLGRFLDLKTQPRSSRYPGVTVGA